MMDIHYTYRGTESVMQVVLGENSYRNRAVMGEDALTLYFSLARSIQDHLGIGGMGLPLGAWCEFQGEIYTLERPENLKKNNSENFEYTLIMEGPRAALRKYILRNTVDKRIKFSVNYYPQEHLEMLVKNLQIRDPQWRAGECIQAPQKIIDYNRTDCMSALNQMAQALDTEWEIQGKTIHLRKAEYNRDHPLALAYGEGKGLLPGVGRANLSDSDPIDVLHVQGGQKNIDPSTYGHRELRLPRNDGLQGVGILYDGKYFQGEDGYSPHLGVNYISDPQGLYVMRADGNRLGVEGCVELEQIYPQRVSQVGELIEVDKENNLYDFTDMTIPQGLDYEKYRTAGEKMTVIFQSGQLAGREFEVNYFHDAKDGKLGRRFEIIPQQLDGVTMPGGSYLPRPGRGLGGSDGSGDKYAIFGIGMPEAYIRHDQGHSGTGAEWDLMREAVKYLCQNQVQKYSITGELDGIWARKNWEQVGGKICLGGYVSFSDEQFQIETMLIRIVGIKQMINNPHSPQIELSNKPVTGSFLSNTVRKVDSQEVVMEEQHSQALQFTKRRFSDAQQTAKMLEGALLNFSESVNPISVNTMQLLLGDESLQFQFVNNKTKPVVVTHNVTYDKRGKKIKAPAGILQHMTLGINLTSEHKASDYQFWDIPFYESPALDEPKVGYYLYVLCEEAGSNNRFLLSKEAKAMDSVAGYYCFLYGVVNSEFDGERSFVPLNGFTEIMPGRLTVPMIVSPDGNTYFDVAKGKIGGNIEFLTKENTTKSLIQGGKIVSDAIDVNTIKVGTKTLITDGKLTTELIDVDKIEARVVNTRAKDKQGQYSGAGIVMSQYTDLLEVYDLDGNIRIALQGGVSGNYVPNIRVQNNDDLMTASSLSPTDLSISSREYQTNYHKDGFYCARRNPDHTYHLTVSLSKDGIYLPPTAKVDMPGVLLWAGGKAKGGVMFYQGAKKHSYSNITRLNPGIYKIWHSIGHTEYKIDVGIESDGWCGAWYWKNKATDSIEIVICGLNSIPTDKNFDVSIIGRN